MTNSNAFINPYRLGASLYMPATRDDIWQVIVRQKIQGVHSIIICLEDAVSYRDVAKAFVNVQKLLAKWYDNQNSVPTNRPLVFIRPRNSQMLGQLADVHAIDLIDGFVLPKVDMTNIQEWQKACACFDGSLFKNLYIMPTLETALVFDDSHNRELIDAFGQLNRPILAVRIGGNDLLSCLNLRKDPTKTLYDSVLGNVLYRLLVQFVPKGFYLTSPVFEYWDNVDVFYQEAQNDVKNGFVGKTVIHPSQIDTVVQAFAVCPKDYDDACAILTVDKAVFKQNNAMLEPATHNAWARHIVLRQEVFGTKKRL